MTVPAENYRITYLGDNTTPTYAYTFKIYKDTDIQVATKVGNVITPLALTTDYTVAAVGLGDPNGGNITLVAGNLPTGTTLVMGRDPLLLQQKDLTNQGAYFAQTHEDAWDLRIHQIQALQELLDRTLHNAFGLEGINPELPVPEPANVFGWNPTLDGIINVAAADFADVADGKVTIDRSLYATDELAGTALQAALIDSAVTRIILTAGDYRITTTTTVTAPKIITGVAPAETGATGTEILLDTAGINIVCGGDTNWSNIVFNGGGLAAAPNESMVETQFRIRDSFYNCKFINSAGNGLGGNTSSVPPSSISSVTNAPMSVINCAALGNADSGFWQMTGLVNCWARDNLLGGFVSCAQLSGS